MIQEILSKLETPLPQMLPHGAINKIAKDLKLSRLTVGAIVNGKYGGNEDTIKEVVNAAVDFINKDSELKLKYAKELQEILAA